MALNLFTLNRNNTLQSRITEYIEKVTLRDMHLQAVADEIKTVKSAYAGVILAGGDTSTLDKKGEELVAKRDRIMKAEYKYTATDADKALVKAWNKVEDSDRVNFTREELLADWFEAQGCGKVLNHHLLTSYVDALTGRVKGSRRDRANGKFDKARKLSVETLLCILSTQYLESGIIKEDAINPELRAYFEKKDAEIRAKKEAVKKAKEEAKNAKKEAKEAK